MADLDLLHTPITRLRRLRLLVAACVATATFIGGHLILDRAHSYAPLIAALKQQLATSEIAQSQRLQRFEDATKAAHHKAILQVRQRHLIQVLRAVGLTRSETAHYTQLRFEADAWRLYGSAALQTDVLSMLSQLRKQLPEDLVTLVHISANVRSSAPDACSAGVRFEMAIQPRSTEA